MILPIEVDDALDALRVARDRVGAAEDEMNTLCAPTRFVTSLTEAHSALSWCVERVGAMVDQVSREHLARRDMVDVEERHVEAQIFPWTEEW